MIRSAIIILFLSVSTAFAQQQPDPSSLQKAIQIVQAQRNRALDEAAENALRAASLAEENSKLKAEIEQLKKLIEARPQ
jgi:cell shape-determining protein MreC